MSEWD